MSQASTGRRYYFPVSQRNRIGAGLIAVARGLRPSSFKEIEPEASR